MRLPGAFHAAMLTCVILSVFVILSALFVILSASEGSHALGYEILRWRSG
jgi:hypothetical protein